MNRIVILASAIVLTTVVGFVEGFRIERWKPRPDPALAGVLLAEIPYQFGDWKGVDAELPEAERQMKYAQLSGYFLRQYVNVKTGDEVRAMIVYGDSGPVSGHPPTLCYQDLGYNVVGVPATRSIEEDGSAFKTGLFEHATIRPLHIWWAWTAVGKWEAPDRPQARFNRAGTLFKLYLIRTVDKSASPANEDAVIAGFAEQFVPLAESKLFRVSNGQ